MAIWNPFKSNKKKLLNESQDVNQTVLDRNPNAQIFQDVADDIDEAVSLRSVVTKKATEQYIKNPTFQSVSNTLIDMPVFTDKKERIKQYRSMALLSDCDWCLDEIADDFIFIDERGEFIKLKLPERRCNEDDLNKERREILQEQFEKYISLFNFKDEAYTLIKRFLVEGELAFENIISPKYPEKGIIGVKFLPAEYYETLMNPKTGKSVGIYFDTRAFSEDVRLLLSQSYLTSTQVFNSMLVGPAPSMNSEDCIPIYWPQLTYINSGDTSPDGTICYPILEKAKQAYHQLALMKDAAVIRRVTRAPERLLFNISTGRMTQQLSDQYVRDFANGLKAKKVTGRIGPDGSPDIAQVYNPVTMLESYVFAKSDANDGTTIDSVSSNENFDEIGDVEFFLRNFLKVFKVPFSRYKTPENTTERDETISYEEYDFARQEMKFQNRFALGFKNGFITHLKLKGIWEKYQLTAGDIKVQFNAPVLYDIYNVQKLVTAKMDTYSSIIDHEEFSKILAMKKILGYTDDEIEENFRNLIKEKQYIQLADFYADKLGSEGPSTFDSPIPIKGMEPKDPLQGDEEKDKEDGESGGDEGGGEDSGNDDSGGNEDSGDASGDEGGGSGNSGPSFGLG